MFKKRGFYSFILIPVLILFLCTTMLFISGCGRRARIKRALQERAEQDASVSEETDAPLSPGEDSEIDQLQDEPQQTDDEDEVDMPTEENIIDEPDNESNEDVSSEDPENEDEAIEEDNQAEDGDIGTELTETAPVIINEGGYVKPDEAYSGNLWGVARVGDDGSENKQSKGYVSFDITGFESRTIVDAEINAVGGDVLGTPFQTYGPMIIKAVYWGQRQVDTDIFEIDGIELANFNRKSFTINGDILKNDLQNCLTNHMDRYQLCMYFEMHGETDGDGIYDDVKYNLEDITLTITYISQDG